MTYTRFCRRFLREHITSLRNFFQALEQDVAVGTKDFFCSIPELDYAGRNGRTTEQGQPARSATAAAPLQLDRSQNQFRFADRTWLKGFLWRSSLEQRTLGSFQGPVGLDPALSCAFCHCWASARAAVQPLWSANRNFLYYTLPIQSFFLELKSIFKKNR